MENKYDIIVNYIESEIKKESFKSKLPSIRALAIKFSCSNSTVIRAYSELEKKGLIYSMPKSGYFILENSLFKQNNLMQDKFDFSSGEPNESIFPVAQFQKYIDISINSYGTSLFNYGHSDGFSQLKTTLCNKYSEKGLNVTEESIYFSNGAQQSISLLSLMKFHNNKDSILVESPSYNIYLGWLKLTKSKVYTIPRGIDGIDLNLLEDLFKNKDLKFFYTMPRLHNPLGTSYNEETKKQILYLANKYDVYILEDDYLSELNNISNKPIKYYDSYEKVIYLKTFSKILLPGARLATISLPEKILEDFRQFKTFCELQGNAVFQCALNEYILSKDYDDYMQNLKIYYDRKMEILKEIINNNSDLNLGFTNPTSGLFSLIQLPNTLNMDEFLSNLRGNKIYIRHGKYFYYNNSENINTARISVAKCNEKEISHGISTLFAILRESLKSNVLKRPKILEL